MSVSEIEERMLLVHNAVIEGIPPLDLLKVCGGYYECPRDTKGNYRGLVVGYAGKYDGLHQWVGRVYADFAKIETFGEALNHVATQLDRTIEGAGLANFQGFCGAPEGGKALASVMAARSGRLYVYPDKILDAPKDEGRRELSHLEFGRHEIIPEAGYLLVEDVCNNFSTTAELIALIENLDGHVVGIACFLNRSLEYDQTFDFTDHLGRERSLPIICLERKRIMQYRQDAPEVAGDIKCGNVVWKPKLEWDRIAAAMAAAQRSE